MRRYISLLLLIGLAWGQEKIVAVFDFSNNGIGISRNEAQTLTDRLRIELVQIGGFKIVERDKIKDLLMEQKLQMSGMVEEQYLIDIGKILGASHIVNGNIGKVGNTYTISARIINNETAEIENAISFDSAYNIEKLLTIGMKEVANNLVGKDLSVQPYTKKKTNFSSISGIQYKSSKNIIEASFCLWIIWGLLPRE